MCPKLRPFLFVVPKVPTAIFAGGADALGDPTDVARLVSEVRTHARKLPPNCEHQYQPRCVISSPPPRKKKYHERRTHSVSSCPPPLALTLPSLPDFFLFRFRAFWLREALSHFLTMAISISLGARALLSTSIPTSFPLSPNTHDK